VKETVSEFSFIRFLCKKYYMHIVVLGDEKAKEEWPQSNEALSISWATDLHSFKNFSPDAFFDLDFTNDNDRINFLKTLKPPVIVNSVAETLNAIQAPFIRINAWAGFFKREIVEACATDDFFKKKVEIIFTALNKKIEWLPDTVGFITPRIIAMIINEAYYALGDGVSTKEEIDTAMKLGTNYPYGPFEWAELIGLKNIEKLLNNLAAINQKYLPATALINEAKAWH
jgi:3-hydroxybutyryl-CoA dehydrogenase